MRTANVNTLPSLVQHAPLIRLRRRALYKFVLIDWLIDWYLYVGPIRWNSGFLARSGNTMKTRWTDQVWCGTADRSSNACYIAPNRYKSNMADGRHFENRSWQRFARSPRNLVARYTFIRLTLSTVKNFDFFLRIADAIFTTDWVAWSVCLCVFICLLVTFVSPATSVETIETLYGWMNRVDPQNHVVCQVEIAHWNVQFLRVVRPIKMQCKSLLRYTLQTNR